MTDSSSIDPPIELMREWSRFQGDTDPESLWFRIAREAARWGADQELGACCELLPGLTSYLREERRPKSLSLKEQALAALEDASLDAAHYNTILRALEQLSDD